MSKDSALLKVHENENENLNEGCDLFCSIDFRV